MQIAKLSLVAAMVLGFSGSVYAADTLADAFKNGKVNGELKAWYWDKTSDGTAQHNENIFNMAVELGYITDTFYGFRLGATFQGNATPFAEENAKTMFIDEEYASGSVLSEAYLGYKIGKTDIKIGRQYINTPLVSGNYARVLKESFEGVTVVNTDLPQTTVMAGYINKFQGRTSNISGDGAGDAPLFAKKIIFGGMGTKSYAFEDAYTLAIINKSISNLTLTAQYAVATDVASSPTSSAIVDDIDMYYTEAKYVVPMNGFKLGFDASYRGSKTGSDLDSLNYEGDMLGGRISISELAGFGASIAYTTVSDDDALIVGMGNGGETYTGMLIRGPFYYSCLAGMDAYKFEVTYDFSKIGVAGLKGVLQYVDANQDAPSIKAGSTAAKTHADYTGYAGGLTYAIPAIKGLTTQLIYATAEKEATSLTNVVTKTDTDELWFKANGTVQNSVSIG